MYIWVKSSGQPIVYLEVIDRQSITSIIKDIPLRDDRLGLETSSHFLEIYPDLRHGL